MPPTLRIVHVIRDLDTVSGGPSRSVPALADALGKLPGVESVVLTTNRGQEQVDLNRYSNASFLIASDQVELRRLVTAQICRNSEITTAVHSHGLWASLNHLAAKQAASASVPVMASPRGMLAAWCFNHKPIKKRIGWYLYQRRDLIRSACIHVTSADEAGQVRAMGIRRPICVVPNGCEITNDEDLPQPDREKCFVFMGRLHPVKGADLLLDAWQRAKLDGWKCLFAGPDEDGYVQVLRDQAARLGITASVEFLGSVEGREKERLLSRATALVLPSHSENFGMAVAESLAAGTPAIATRGTPWSDLESFDCGWWIERSPSELAQALKAAASTTQDRLESMGRNGRKLIRDRYSWQGVAERLVAAYRWMIDPNTSIPDSISPSR